MGLFRSIRSARLWLVLLLLFGVAGCKTYHPMEEAVTAMAGSDQVAVSEDNGAIYFVPQAPRRQGFIFYPGAGVKPAGYAPMALDVAEAGFTVAIAKFPLNLAVLSPNRADAIRTQFPDVTRWALGGHSLGGVMAAQYLFRNAGDSDLNGLIMLAAYPGNSNDLSDSSFNAVSLFASEDRLTKPADIDNTRHLMPPNTVYHEIAGGNHSQFGWYGQQDGDGIALISRQDQALAIRDRIVWFLDGI